MLLLELTFFAILFPIGDTQDAFKKPISFHIIQITSFAHNSWVKYQGSGWLGDLQIHGWDSDSGTAIFLKPWSKCNFSDEVFEVVELFRVHVFTFIQETKAHVNVLKMEYPFVIQVIAGCKLHSAGAILSFLPGAFGGLDFVGFKNYSCVPAPEGGSRAQNVCILLAPYHDIFYTVEKLLCETCPQYLLGVLEAGKADLQKQVLFLKPKAWLSSDSAHEPSHLQLVCHVSGFYPKPQELPETQRGDILPNADDTWYLRMTLDVVTEEATGLSCQVKHSSLGRQDIVFYWGHSNSIGRIILAIVSSLIFFLCFALWLRLTCVNIILSP
uniref:Immunoglobulin C1-set domain-containing protein n=1 Tax=Cavia porcellus TaxID=10141 RepID=A0A286XTK6_CAVPO